MTPQAPPLRSSETEYAIDLLRAFAGAVLFALPLLMTMEMWELGAAMDRWRLLLFLAVNLLTLLGLSYHAGFRETFSLKEDALDALAAAGVGILVSAGLLALLGQLTWGMPLGEAVGMIAIQSVPASIGAMAARGQLGDRDGSGNGGGEGGGEEARRASYAGDLVLMCAGAQFLAFNVAPTEEMVVLALRMTPWHALGLVGLSVALLHALVYSLGFAGQKERPDGTGPARAFLVHSLAGYGIALAVSLYLLWTFGRTDGQATTAVAMMTTVLAFPAALGAAVARLIV